MKPNASEEGENKGKCQGSFDDRSGTRREGSAKDEEKRARETIQVARQTKG